MDIKDVQSYQLMKEENLPDIQSKGYLLKHKKSGAHVMLVSNEDENKVFHIAFRTPPANSTGLPHILEHSVLCGSREFPSKDPFVELVKGSLNTFLNAMTYPDKTMYPVASCNDKDFQNLMHVYMDAVLYPNIYKKEEIFRQEGWSYHLEEPDGELTYNGVVYNEMKGAFSSPDDVLEREILNSLFPDTPYGVESGGDPECIPDLTYEEFLAFHKKYYHPSNSYIYLYGNMDMAEKLNWLDEAYLSDFDEISVDSALPMQDSFEKPLEIRKKYAISNTDSEEDNTYISYNTVCGTSEDVQMSNAFAVIEYALLDAPGAPLKQALLDAGVGKDIYGSYDSGIMQPVFTVTAKNSNPEKKEQFLQIINGVLGDIVKKGLNQKAILAGINYMEFRYREADYGSFPKGLMYGIDAMDSWLYNDQQPFLYLNQIPVYDKLKQLAGTGYYENLIQTYLLDNPHASVVMVEPEKGLTGKMDEETKEKLASIKAAMSQEEIHQLIENTKKLKEFQEAPATREELEAIPVLDVSDIKKEVEGFFNTEKNIGGQLALHHNIQTNGIGYLSLLFDIKNVPEKYVSYLGILKSVLGMVDTENYTYSELFNEINMQTGGINAGVRVISDKRDRENYRGILEITAKTLYEKLDFTFRMIEEIIFTSKLEDEKRLYEIIAQIKSRLESHLTSAGHATAAARSMAYFSEISAFNDRVSGIEFFKLIEDIEGNFEERKDGLMQVLKELMVLIFRRDNLIISLTADEKGYQQMENLATAFVEKLPKEKLEEEKYSLVLGKRNEGFTTSSKVQYVGRSGNYRDAGLEYTGALRILKVILSYEYLWVNIRVKGGAYGCMSGFGMSGDCYFASYRDPNLRQTNQVFEGITDYVANFDVDPRDMNKYIIGTISELDTPMTPKMKGIKSMGAYLGHLEVEDMQRERDQILNATKEDIQALAEIVKAVLAQENLCVVGGEEKIKEEKDLFMAVKPLVG